MVLINLHINYFITIKYLQIYKDYATPIDYNFLQKAVYSNRRSKDMKLEIARAFGEIKSIYRSATNWADVERDYGQSSSQSICKYELNNEVYEIIGNFGYKSFNDVTQYTDLQIKDWIADLIFSDFEYPLNDDRVKEKLLEWYRNQVNKPTAQPNTPTPQDPNLQNAKFKVGDKVKITNIGLTKIFNSPSTMASLLLFLKWKKIIKKKIHKIARKTTLLTLKDKGKDEISI